MPPFDDDVVSPELALVDPELAARARAAIPDFALHRLAAAGAAADAATTSAVSHSIPRKLRHRVPATPTLTLLATAAASLIVTSVTGQEAASGKAPIASGVVLESAARSSADDVAGSTPVAHRVAQSPPSPRADANGSRPAATRQALAARRPTSLAPVKRRSGSQGPRFASTTTTLVWRREPRATSYEVELVRGDTVIFTSTSPSSHVVLPTRWQRGGKAYTIHPEDQAFVWPVVNGRRGERPVVSGALALDLSPVVRFFELDRD